MRKLPAFLATLTLLAGVLAPAGCAPGARPRTDDLVAHGPDAASTAPRELTADQQVRHALSRLAFGARPGDYERVRAIGVDRWIAEQLRPERIDDGATDAFLARFPTLAMSSAELARDYPQPNELLRRRERELARAGRPPTAVDSAADRRARVLTTREDSLALRRAAQRAQRVYGEVQAAKVARAVASYRQLEEVMVDFWENHFNVFAGKGPTRYMLAEYERDAIRRHALGRFRDLLGAVAKSPAMLFYLDNWQSAADSGRPRLTGTGNGRVGTGRRARRVRRIPVPTRPPSAGTRPFPVPGAAQRPRGLNENYARELLELHTLGVDGGYTQQDVINVARAFTGWSIENPRQGGGFVFRPVAHDAGQKVVLGHRLAAGRGIDDGEEVLDIVARHPAAARFIAAKLVRRFVSDSAPPALVERAAETFRRTDGDIRAVVRTIVTSPEFFARAAYRAKVKSPFELVVSALRAVGAAPDSTPRTAQLVARLGQPLFGHQAPNGYPEVGEPWINTGAILNRINFGIALAAGRVPGAPLAAWPQGAALAGAPREEQVDGVIAALLGGEASPDTRRILERGANPLLERAGAAADSMSLTTDRPEETLMGESADELPPRGLRAQRDALGRPAELTGLAQIVGLALGAPEFQRR